MSRPLTVVITALTVLLGSCDAHDAGEVGGGVDTGRYARTVCAGLISWRDGIAADSAALTRSLATVADVAAVRSRYARFFSGTVGRTDRLLGAVRTAGAPDADQGMSYARDLAAVLERTRAGLADARTRFAALATADPAAYAAGARQVRDSLDALFAEVGATVDRLGAGYSDPALTGAFREEPACRRLAGS